MINNIWFKIMPEKLTKLPNFTRFLHEKFQLDNKTTRSRPDRGQNLEAEAEAKASRPRPRPRPKFWPRGHFGLEDLTSLSTSHLKIVGLLHELCVGMNGPDTKLEVHEYQVQEACGYGRKHSIAHATRQ